MFGSRETETLDVRRLRRRARGAACCSLVSLGAGAGTAARAAAPVSTALPTISGTPQVGQVLTAGDGTWSNVPTSYAYQWLRCNADGKACKNVGKATQKTYTLAGADAKHTMRVAVTATNADGSASAQSAQTAVGDGGCLGCGAGEHVGSDDHRDREGRSDADGERGELVGQADRLRLRVAAL